MQAFIHSSLEEHLIMKLTCPDPRKTLRESPINFSIDFDKLSIICLYIYNICVCVYENIYKYKISRGREKTW